jgi:signal transduction histidine kinase
MPEPPDLAARAAADERARFEGALAELAAGFINLPPQEVDAAVDAALMRIVEFLGVDRITLIRAMPDDALVVTHASAVQGIAPVPPGFMPNYPWTIAELRAGRYVCFSNPDELPDEAPYDRANWKRIGVASNLTVPVQVGGKFDGALAFACLREPRQWRPEVIARARMLATMLGNALAHQRAMTELASAMRFERLMSHSLASLMTAGRTELDSLIRDALRDAAGVLGADRATLWRRPADGLDFVKSHRYAPEDDAPGAPTPSAVRLPWIMREIASDRAVSMFVSEMPPEADADVRALREWNVQSMVVVPLAIGGSIAGALSFANMREERGWPSSLMPRVKLFGEVLASAIARDQALQGERDARAEAAHAARLGTMGVVAASLAHELTQPLAAIMSNAETAKALVAREAIDRDELRATIDDILSDDRRAGTLIHQLRRFLRRDEVDRAAIDVRRLLDEMMSLMRGEATGKGVALDLDAPQALPCVTGNHAQVLQVVLNLVLNAFDAVARLAPGKRRVKVSAGESGASVIIAVVDNGVGMDEAAQLRAFAPFYTTKPKGMGLGLSISRSIAESHGGSLSVRSSANDGSEFRFVLPAAAT